MSGYNVNGDLIDTETFEDIFDVDPTILEDLSVDYVTGVNRQSVFGASVIAADADTGRVHVSIGVIDSSALSFNFDAEFDTEDRVITGNLSRENDSGPSKLHPELATDEILVVQEDSGVIDVYQYQSVSGFPIIHIATLDLGIESPDLVAVGDIGNTDRERIDDFGRFGQDGLAEIIVADPDGGPVRVFDHTGTEIETFNFGLDFEPGDRIVTGDVSGAGGEDIVVANPAAGSVDIFDVSINGLGDLIDVKLDTINVGFGPDDTIDLADINGNGIDEILVAQADTGNIDVFRYDLVEQTIFSEPSLSVGYAAGDIFTAMPIRYPDFDGDGLFDHWETHGVDVNADGRIDIDLPSMGADPRHKDLFVEFDYVEGQEPSRDAVQLVKEAFAAAPVFAGGVRNADREPGINLWIDTGSLTEGGQLVGDNLGGGNSISSADVPSDGICGLRSSFTDVDFSDIKADPDNFDPVRTHVFRYGLSIAKPAIDCGKSGEAEIGGNDFVEHINTSDPSFNAVDEAALIMHELGHNLSLLHGGFENLNCKPNYTSVMNYNHGSGIYRNGGGRVIDYSPAQVTTERANAPLPPLVEASLDETTKLDPTDSLNMVVFASPNGVTFRRPANEAIDWNDDDAFENDVAANIDNTGSCRNDEISGDPFEGHDDWQNIILSVRNSDGSAAGAVVEPEIDEPTVEELIELKEDLFTADLEISQTADPNPAVAGAELTYSLTIANHGPNPADEVQVINTLPDGVAYQDSSSSCEHVDGTVTCNLGAIGVDESLDITITVLVEASLGLDQDEPAVITNTATVSDQTEFAEDPDTSNNSSSLETVVEIQSDLELVSFEPTSTPVELVVGQPSQIAFETVVTNHGPSGPVSATFAVTEPKSGPVIAGVSSLNRTEDLAAGEQRTLSGTVLLTCSEPGTHEVAVVNTVELREARGSDPNPDNNQAAAEISVECLLPVAINIKPGSETNPVNPNSQVPVALLTTDAGQYGLPEPIDVAQIEPASILFGAPDQVLGEASPTGATPKHGNGHLEDALELDERTRDGDTDLVLHFSAAESGLETGDSEACLRAEIRVNRTDTLEVFGCDTVTIRP